MLFWLKRYVLYNDKKFTWKWFRHNNEKELFGIMEHRKHSVATFLHDLCALLVSWYSRNAFALGFLSYVLIYVLGDYEGYIWFFVTLFITIPVTIAAIVLYAIVIMLFLMILRVYCNAIIKHFVK